MSPRLIPMRLVTRLTWFFLAAMAVVLVGFSVAVYAIVSQHLHRQIDEQLASALNTLAAASEVGPEGLDWEPEERSLSFGPPALRGQFFWRVSDGHGKRVDGSATGAIDQGLARLAEGNGSPRRKGRLRDESGAEWEIVTHRHDSTPQIGDASHHNDHSEGKFSALVFGAAASLEEAKGSLRNLAVALTGISLVVWTFALISGRRFCQAALRPLTEMAEAARAVGVDDTAKRLPTQATGDELEDLGKTVNALLDRLGESLERQQRFAGDAAHQLCTPLTVLQGQVELALRQDRPEEEYRRVLTLFLSKTKHLRQIVDGLMFLSTADAEAMRPKLERIALDPWIRDHLKSWSHDRGSDVVYDVGHAGDCHVFVQPPLLGELMNNLLDNAKKYGPPGSPIRIRLSQTASDLSISVSDGGSGIAPEDLPHIFDPFFRAESARIRGTTGNGLGLSIAARIATIFGAGIIAESRPGQGATFTVTFPKSDPTDAGAIPKEQYSD